MLFWTTWESLSIASSWWFDAVFGTYVVQFGQLLLLLDLILLCIFIDFENLIFVGGSMIVQIRNHISSKRHGLRSSGHRWLDISSICKWLRTHWSIHQSCMGLSQFINWFKCVRFDVVHISSALRLGLLPFHHVCLCFCSYSEWFFGLGLRVLVEETVGHLNWLNWIWTWKQLAIPLMCWNACCWSLSSCFHCRMLQGHQVILISCISTQRSAIQILSICKILFECVSVAIEIGWGVSSCEVIALYAKWSP